MHSFFHTLGVILVPPYVVMAAGLVLIGEAARAKGLLAIFDVMLIQTDWLLRWGIYGFALVWFVLVERGFFDQFE